jgi:hypothetical protein
MDSSEFGDYKGSPRLCSTTDGNSPTQIGNLCEVGSGYFSAIEVGQNSRRHIRGQALGRNHSAGAAVPRGMNSRPQTAGASTRIWIPIGAGIFIVALAASAYLIPELRLLHFLQALIYVAVIILARRNNPWGFGAGATIAVVWNSFSIFVTHLIPAGVVAFWSFLRTGHVRGIDTMVVALGGVGHFILIIASLVAVLELKHDHKKWWKFLAGGTVTIAYFVAIVAIARPR